MDRVDLSQLQAFWNLSKGTESKDGRWASGPTPDGIGTFEYLEDPQPLTDDNGALPNPDPRLDATPKKPSPGQYTGPNPFEGQNIPATVDKNAVEASKKMIKE